MNKQSILSSWLAWVIVIIGYGILYLLVMGTDTTKKLSLRFRPRVTKGYSTPNVSLSSSRRSNSSSLKTSSKVMLASSTSIELFPRTTQASTLMSPASVSTETIPDTPTLSSRGARLNEMITPKTEKLKTSKFTISNESKNKARSKKTQHHREKNDLKVESPEFQLLVKLFMPSKFLIRNDKLSVRQVSNNLPVLIKESYPKLNFEIHLFLSTIVTKYITSWYLTKLNTDDFEFIQNVYQMLCDFIKNCAKRISRIMELPSKLLNLIDDLTFIFDNHLKELVSDDPNLNSIKVVDDYFRQARTDNTVNKFSNATASETLLGYLANRHVLFDHSACNSSGYSKFEFFDDSNSMGLYQSEEKSNDANLPHLIYFRILVKEIIQATFRDDDSFVSGPGNSGPTSSVITMKLIILIVSDLILDKIFTNLSSPEFCLGLIDQIIDSLIQAIEKPKKKTSFPTSTVIEQNIMGFFNKAYTSINSFMGTSSSADNNDGNPIGSGSTHIFNFSVFSLIDTITNISNRRPSLYHSIGLVSSWILLSPSLATKIDNMIKSFISSKILGAGFLKDDFIAQVVNQLKENLFGEKTNSNEKEEEKNEEENKVSVESLTDKTYDLLQNKISSLIPGGARIFGNFFGYQGENEAELKKRIAKFFTVFNYDPENSSNYNSLNENCELNKLLMVKWLDCLIGELYPELLSK